MRNPPSVSPFLERLLHLAAGPHIAEPIIGDLEEQISQRAPSQFWIWKQVAASFCSLLIMQVRSLSRRDVALSCLALIGALLAIGVWEQAVARQVSWPIAKELLDVSPLSTGNTCRAVYVFVYGGFALGLMAVFSSVARRDQRSPHYRIWQVLALGLIASGPAVFLMINPLPTDGAVWFRIAQLGFVWSIAIAFISRSKLRIPITQ